METGWIKIHRKLLKKGFYRNSKYVHLWIHLLLLASHDDKEFMWNGKLEKLKPGQFITGRLQLASDTGLKQSTVQDIMSFFEKEGQIQQQKNNKFRLITIVNWKSHQEVRQLADNKPTSSRHIQELKNVKKNTSEQSSQEIFVLEDAMQKLDDSPRRDLNIVSLYWRKADLKFPSKVAAQQNTRMCLKHIKDNDLGSYEDKKLLDTMQYLTKQDYAWNLATVGKFITRDLTKLKNGN